MSNKREQSISARVRARRKPENQRYVRKNLDIARQVKDLLKEKGLTQVKFAQLLGKQPSEVSRWLSGLHNLTLESITKMEAVLDADIILTPMKAREEYEQVTYLTVYARPTNRYAATPMRNELAPMVMTTDSNGDNKDAA